MDPELFRRVKAIFDEAVEVPPEEREALVRERCAGEPSLHKAVLDLLRHDRVSRDLLQPPSDTRSPTSAEAPLMPTLEAGTEVGHFRIESILGIGGFGVVYKARQERPSRDVALKLIRPGLASERLLRRFELEAELLARLQHPGIAHVYETGALETPAGTQPYFAMELVEGRPLDRYVEETKPSVKVRLLLFASICDAVHHAHSKGILHRDLKPSNILITLEGAPKILDFGVARALDSDLQLTTFQTEVGQLIGTIPYMSPEQAAADPAALDTRSDVYTLGVVLYEMLAGRLPHDMRKRMIHEAVRVIREEEPTRLSAVDRSLRGDVETIVGKALEKEPDRRYQSAADLAADVRRHLEDQPIVARRPSASYQLRKFARRNKVLVAGVAATFVVLVAGIVATSWQAISATRARDDAERAARFQAEMLAGVDPDAMGREIFDLLRAEVSNAMRAREASGAEIEQAIADLDRLLVGINTTNVGARSLDANVMTPAVEAIDEQFTGRPLLRARLLESVAVARQAVGLFAEALPLQTEVVRIRRDRLGPRHPDTLTSVQHLGDIKVRTTDFEGGLECFLDVLEGRRRMLGPHHPETLEARANVAGALADLRRSDEALAEIEATINGLTRTVGAEDRRTYEARSLQGSLLMDVERFEEALEILLDVEPALAGFLEADDPEMLACGNNIAACYFRLGRLDDAVEHMLPVMETLRRKYGDRHPRSVSAINNISMLLHHSGDPDRALPFARTAYEGTLALYPRNSPKFVVASNSMSIILIALERFAEAERYAIDSATVAQQVLGPSHPYTAGAIENVSDLYAKWHEAEPGAGHDAKAAEWRAKLPAGDDAEP